MRGNEVLKNNFLQKFKALNKVKLADSEFSYLKNEIVTAD